MTPTESQYKLYLCASETGREGNIDSGSESEMIAKLQDEAKQGKDVWIITPDGSKILPKDVKSQ